jgi:3-phosphoshikimate 1-carboxyvinyltransferase
MMQKIIHPSFIKGVVDVPPSKSMTLRAIAAAFLAQGDTTISNPSPCNDSLAALDLIRRSGARVISGDGKLIIQGGFNLQENELNCGESGLAMRMFAPIVALQNKAIAFIGEGSLLKRPVDMIGEAMTQLGVVFKSSQGLLPFSVHGPLQGGKAIIDGSISSQLLTGLLMALPLAEADSEIRVNNLRSKLYIAMTIKLLRDFGVSVENLNYELFKIQGKQNYLAGEYTVEGDWSGAAFLLVAGAINGNLTLNGLLQSSEQPDRAILDVLKTAGARMKVKPHSIEIEKSDLTSFYVDATECPDLFPPLAVLAAYCKGASRIRGLERLVYKESNRALAIQEEMRKLGINITFKGNDMIIEGGKVSGAFVNSHNDHRIAMMEAVAAIGATGFVTIQGSESVAKSYPGFFDDFIHLGVEVM